MGNTAVFADKAHGFFKILSTLAFTTFFFFYICGKKIFSEILQCACWMHIMLKLGKIVKPTFFVTQDINTNITKPLNKNSKILIFSLCITIIEEIT